MTQQLRSTGPSGLCFSTLLLAAVAVAGVFLDRQMTVDDGARPSIALLGRELALQGWSPEVRRVAAWAIDSNDHGGRPFVIIDQARARLFAFSGQGRLVGSTPLVRSVAWADPPAPAGRFVADISRSARAGAIVWANAGRALSLRAAAAEPSPRRLASAEADEDRQAGSFQVAGEFYRQHLRAFRHQASVAYVLPDTPSLRRNFMLYAAGPGNPTRNIA